MPPGRGLQGTRCGGPRGLPGVPTSSYRPPPPSTHVHRALKAEGSRPSPPWDLWGEGASGNPQRAWGDGPCDPSHVRAWFLLTARLAEFAGSVLGFQDRLSGPGAGVAIKGDALPSLFSAA